MEEAERSLTARGLLLGSLLSIVYTSVNAFLAINFGISLGFGIITILLAYLLFQRVLGSSSRSEIACTFLLSGGGTGVAVLLGFLIFLRERLPSAQLPAWLVPPPTVIARKELVSAAWLPPLATILFLTVASMLFGYIYALAVGDLMLRDERMVFPMHTILGTLINTCYEQTHLLKRVAHFIALGFLVTFVQYILRLVGVNVISIDLTPVLPEGLCFGVFLSLGFLAIGYIISARVALSLFISSLATYLVAAPILVHVGGVTSARSMMSFYTNLLYGFTLSPGVGMMILSGMLVALIQLLRRRRRNGGNGISASSVTYWQLYKALFLRILRSRSLAAAFISLLSATVLVSAWLNFFDPYPPILSAVFTLLFVLFFGFLDFVIIAKMCGEAGITTGVHQMVLYDVPILLSGYQGYTAYQAQRLVTHFTAWEASDLVGWIKVREKIGLGVKTILKSVFISRILSILISIVFVLLAWKYVGFGNEIFPSISFIQMLPILRMFAERRMQGIIDPISFLLGGALGTLLESFTPASFMGVALGMMLPPSYGVPIGIGGLIRLITDRKYGPQLFREKGMVIATGLVAGSLLTQVLMSIFIH